MNDLKFAIRQLLKNPGFTAVAVLTLALGIGANLGLFAMLNELLLRPKPVVNPDELWAIEPADLTGEPVFANVCRPYYEAVRQHARVFKGVVGYAGIMAKLRTKEAAERSYVELVSGDYFSFLGITPALGRWFLPEEDAKMGTHSVAVISYGFWQRQLGESADVIGSTVTLNGKVIEIVGVAPREFSGLDFMQPALWLPTSMEKLMDETTRYHLVGRLAEPKLAVAAADLISPVVTEVTKELSGFKDPQWSRYGLSPNFQRVRLEPIGRGLLGVAFVKKRILDFLKFAGVATVLLLLIACANVASLFLVRALQRRKEMATRLALGATRGALVRQLVGEGILVAALGTAGALLAFSWIGGIITQLASWWQGPDLHPTLDLRLLLFAAGSLLLVGVGFSLFPALSATGFQLFNALKDAEGSDGSDRKRAWLRHGLIVAQIVGSLALLCGATLCLRSMSKQLAVDIPQLKSPDGNFIMFGVADVGPGAFAALGIPLLHGREVNQTDVELNHKVAVVNESFVRKFWPDQEPLGKQIEDVEVIGVVRDARFSRFDVAPGPMVFWGASKESLLQAKLLVRAKRNPRHLIGDIHAELARIHPMLVQGEICTLRDTMKNALRIQHTALRILGILGGLALALCAIGTYGLMAYVVTRRTREIGVRIALGATRGLVMKLILTAGLRLGLIALAIGLPLALGAAGILRHQLAGISPFDPLSFIAVTLSVQTAVICACWLPALRAARVDPMEALRCE